MITIQSELDLVYLRESEDTEFKTALGKDRQGELPVSFWETYSALANTNGGYIFLGISEKDDRFRFVNLPSTDHLRKQIVDLANNRNKVSVNLLTNDSLHDLRIAGNLVLCVHIPRATRQQRPVYLNGNPLGNSYRRLHEADQRLDDEVVKRYLAEQLGDTRDSEILPEFDLQDISQETLQAYRQIHVNLQPGHFRNALDDLSFLEQIGGARRNRRTKDFSLTVAGLLMFGTHRVIQEIFPYYMLDYQEHPPTNTQIRWTDRLTLDGMWSGNLFDFHRRVYLKLVADLKTPFQLNGDIRIDETPAHVALREALVNTLVHADYSDRASVLIIKRPHMFTFRNPGLMRVSWEAAMTGGESDCRNRTLQQMFRYVGLGEQAGSGIPKILDGWKKSHWRPPSLYEKTEPNDQTLMELWMIDLFPPGTVETLRQAFHGKRGVIDYDRLDHNSQVALALAYSERMVNHERLKQLTDKHSADLSQTLQQLVDRRVLQKTGKSRGAVYHLFGQPPPLDPDDVFGPETDSTHLGENSTHLGENSTYLDMDSTHLDANSTHLDENAISLDTDSTHLDEKSLSKFERNKDGCIISKRLEFPVVDKLCELSDELRGKLEQLATGARTKGKIPQEEMEQIIISSCSQRYMSLAALARLLKRSDKTLRNSYLSRMVKEKKLRLAFPAKPNSPRQAYIAVESLQEEQTEYEA